MTATTLAWLILAGVCLLLELATSGYVFLWMAASAALTGLVSLLAPGLAWQWQLLGFSAAAVAGTAALRARRARGGDGAAGLNRRADAFVGRTAVLETELVPGANGRLRLGDTTWAASGPALPAGARVRVTGVRGSVLVVEPEAAPAG